MAHRAERKRKKKARKRAAFTLEARFLKAKDETLQGNGITMNRISKTKVYNVKAVMDLYLVLRRVLKAFEVNPNDRKAYKLGLDTLPKLKNLLDIYLPRLESETRPPKLVLVK